MRWLQTITLNVSTLLFEDNWCIRFEVCEEKAKSVAKNALGTWRIFHLRILVNFLVVASAYFL
jgi:hypothetical protein